MTSLDIPAGPTYHKERKGVVPMWKKLIAPIIITALLGAYLVFYFVVILQLPQLSFPVKLALALIPLALLGVAVYNLFERIHEIRSGEEDDLDNY